ncbi:dihydroorotate dehydrogenase electron transfer subunit [Paraconexibacter antarcticus]|uniref:Dihydroorotate dehydrogenase electron transfer subunit n=1 Tax=Paraconexibacter antarcticus TaxID=2949664 RepID=A0ABY5DME3_9ACTN|nr:dihydroorotate dehydrogenase electron transfer subunit [Paraconexibacter antarcticus]UTI62741.1 dihydroorotate dehydrogenase electron transfer subunit [Paraconexibacter antarcticus]
MTQAPFGRRRGVLASIRKVGAYHLLEVVDRGGPDPEPGQFYMLAAVSGWGAGTDERPFLPRAFSCMGGSAGRVWFMLEDIGPGTHRLARLQKGEPLWLTGPLGHGFRMPEDGRRPILTGGGVGVPPLVMWSQALVERGARPTLQFGFRDAAHAAVAASFDTVQIATDDGSVGHHGLVTELLAAELHRDPHATVYSCGPPGMLEAIRRMCLEREVPAQLALESGMACGFGACFGCVVPLSGGGYARVCVDGPVLDATAIDHVPAH